SIATAPPGRWCCASTARSQSFRTGEMITIAAIDQQLGDHLQDAAYGPLVDDPDDIGDLLAMPPGKLAEHIKRRMALVHQEIERAEQILALLRLKRSLLAEVVPDAAAAAAKIARST